MPRGLLAAAASVLLAAPQSLAGSLEDCERLLRRGDEERAARCFERVSGAPSVALKVKARLSALRVEGRAGGWLLRVLGIREAVAGAPEAEATLGSAVAAFSAAADLRGEAVARATLADFFSRRRRFAETEQELRLADALAANSGQPDAVARVRYQEAQVALRRQDPLGGLARMDAGEEAAQASHDDDLLADWHQTRAMLLWMAGRYPESLEAYRRQIEVLERLGETARIADVLANMTFSTTDARQTRSLAEDALDRATRSGNLNAEVKARFTLAEIDDGEAGLTHSLRGLDAARRLGDEAQLRMALRAAGFRLAKSGKREGLDLLREAVESATKAGDPAEQARCSFILSRTLWEVGPREDAIRASLASLDAAEETRTGPASAESRAVRFGQWNRLYYRAAGYVLAGTLLERPHEVPPEGVALAFRISERMKARNLLDSLDAAAQIRDVAPVFASLDDMRAALAPDEALVSFLINAEKSGSSSAFDGGSWLFTVSRESVRFFRLKTHRKELEEQASLLVGLVEGRSGREATGAAALYDVLLKEALSSLPDGVKRLLVVPDRSLHYLPLGLLRPRPDAEPISSRYEFVTIPSATVWLRLRGLAGPATAALSFADPSLPADAGSAGASPAERSGRLGPLAVARREGRALVARAGPGSRLVVGAEASERAFKQVSFASYGVVHMGAHALADEQSSDHAMLLLAPGEGEDGRLKLEEIRRLPLSGQLVILAACRSTTGEYVHGEGALGLASSFLLSGARAVLGTLWAVRDDEAEEFSKAFFVNLSGGRTASAAVAAAQRTLRARGRPPAAWAAFVLIGDGSIAPIRETEKPWIAALAVLVAAGVLAAVFFLRPRRPAARPSPR
ncbi:MAG: CHAT domain-containing protein [Thermoanaerobaculia bacterium]|nr:CHAT domain-containing protein [Thermoanaerobaculia bacterium]